MCKHCFISAVATYFAVYFLIVAITQPMWSIWLNSLVITVLMFIAVMSCHMTNKEGWTCCVPSKKIAKRK